MTPAVQQACSALEDELEIRFYDHFEDEFDASLLDSLDEIRRLSIDGLPRLRNADAVGRLPKLISLRFGPVRIENAKILSALGVDRLQDFTLAGTPTPTIDLAPFADARLLRSLRLLGHGKNTEAIGYISSLSELALQPSSKFSLDFINGLEFLKSLKLVLGNTQSICSIATRAARPLVPRGSPPGKPREPSTLSAFAATAVERPAKGFRVAGRAAQLRT